VLKDENVKHLKSGFDKKNNKKFLDNLPNQLKFSNLASAITMTSTSMSTKRNWVVGDTHVKK